MALCGVFKEVHNLCSGQVISVCRNIVAIVFILYFFYPGAIPIKSIFNNPILNLSFEDTSSTSPEGINFSPEGVHQMTSKLGESAGRYFYESLTALSRTRTTALAHHKDLSSSEVSLMK